MYLAESPGSSFSHGTGLYLLSQEPCGWPSRFCTLFLYLSDSQEGGRTRFRWLDGAAFRPLGAQRVLYLIIMINTTE